jgi:hypothetical protein
MKTQQNSSNELNFKFGVYGRVPQTLETKIGGRSTSLGDDITDRTEQKNVSYDIYKTQSQCRFIDFYC